MAPSPTAAATRLVEPLRTSPTANMPGRLVSSSERCQPASAGPVGHPVTGLASGPVRTKPRSSRSTSPPSHPVQGAAPTNTNRARASERAPRTGQVVPRPPRLQRLVPDQLSHLGAEQDPHVRQPRDLTDQVPGHVLAEIRFADDQADLIGVPGQEDRGLSGRVAAADARHRVAPAQLRLDLRRGVVDALPSRTSRGAARSSRR